MNIKKGGKHKSSKIPDFAARALRALRRAAHQARAENRALGLPLIVWRKGKLERIPA